MSHEPYGAEYLAIYKFYGHRRAKRSDVPLMNHIAEGLEILDALHAGDRAKAAFCLHPIVQNNEDVDVSWSTAYPLACEYRDRANSYLCRPDTDCIQTVEHVGAIVGPMSKACVHMLFADKLQNQRDFLRYHRFHDRAPQLGRYFALWIAHLTPLL